MGGFVVLLFLDVPVPIPIGGAALAGLILQDWQPEVFRPAGHGGAHAITAEESSAASLTQRHRTFSHALKAVVVFLALWLVPFAPLYPWRGRAHTPVPDNRVFPHTP